VTAYYATIIDYIEKQHNEYKTLDKKQLTKFIIKTLSIQQKSAYQVVRKLKELGYITEQAIPAKKIIKFVERD
jgi:DNA-binding MarR family transcriptional regulator